MFSSIILFIVSTVVILSSIAFAIFLVALLCKLVIHMFYFVTNREPNPENTSISHIFSLVLGGIFLAAVSMAEDANEKSSNTSRSTSSSGKTTYLVERYNLGAWIGCGDSPSEVQAITKANNVSNFYNGARVRVIEYVDGKRKGTSWIS